MAMASTSTPPRHTCLFLTSPLKPSTTPESLMKTLPRDAVVKFWTVEKTMLSPKTTKEISARSGRQVMAFLSGHADIEMVCEKSMFKNLDKLKEEKALESDKKLSCILEEVLNRLEDQQKKIQRLQEQIFRLHEEREDVHNERDIYSPFHSTRRLTVVGLMACLLKYLNHYFLRQLNIYEKWLDWIGNRLPFSKFTDVSYFKAWWYSYHEIMQVDKMSLEDYWKAEIGYSGTKASTDSKKKRKVGSKQSMEVAQEVQLVMLCAEEACIKTVGNDSISPDRLRKALGFYISLSRPDRNMGQHLIENLFAINKRPGPVGLADSMLPKNPFISVDEEFFINDNLRDQGAIILSDILCNLDKLGDYTCIQDVVKWFAQWLLSLCSVADEDEADKQVAVDPLFFNHQDPPPPIVPPPTEPRLQQHIDKLVEYVARNGPQFEDVIKERYGNDPRFAFLFGAEGSSYYKYKLSITVNPPLAAADPNFNHTPASGLIVNTSISPHSHQVTELNDKSPKKDTFAGGTHWEWYPELQRALCLDCSTSCYYDLSGCAWTRYDNEWLVWSQAEERWCSWRFG